jgi:hypothetical protein
MWIIELGDFWKQKWRDCHKWEIKFALMNSVVFHSCVKAPFTAGQNK